jgi:hypothetical protein
VWEVDRRNAAQQTQDLVGARNWSGSLSCHSDFGLNGAMTGIFHILDRFKARKNGSKRGNRGQDGQEPSCIPTSLVLLFLVLPSSLHCCDFPFLYVYMPQFCFHVSKENLFAQYVLNIHLKWCKSTEQVCMLQRCLPDVGITLVNCQCSR